MKKFLKLRFIILNIVLLVLFFPMIVHGQDNEAYTIGYTEGYIEGINLAYENKENPVYKNYLKAIPKDRDIEYNYNLNKESTYYKLKFIEGFKDGFKEGYNKIYENLKVEYSNMRYDDKLALEMGKIFGYRDYYENKKNEWQKSIPSTNTIIKAFDLTKESVTYKNNFLNEFSIIFRKGYEQGYSFAKFDTKTNDILKGVEDGKRIGEYLGIIYGKKDFTSDKISDWGKSIISDIELTHFFSLDKDNQNYKISFIQSFKNSFKEKYIEGYRNASIDHKNLLFEEGYNYGNILGKLKGSQNGKIDYSMGKPNDSKMHTIIDNRIIDEYDLSNQNVLYNNGFIAGYKEGYHKGYSESYNLNLLTNHRIRLTNELIPIGGAEVITNDFKVKIVIDSGTFYNDTILSIDKRLQTEQILNSLNEDRYIKNSDFYLLKISNPYKEYNDDKVIKIIFEYYAGLNGGIYRYHYGSWNYIPSIIKDSTIVGHITSKQAQENSIYAVFIDKQITNPIDIRGHWAKDEIITALKRGYIELRQDKVFRPDENITRFEALKYLSSVNNWMIELNEQDIMKLNELEDFNKIEDYKEIVSYSITNKIFKVSKDNYFSPNESITYSELEKAIGKIEKYKDFDWKYVSDKMMMIKDTRCKSRDSMENCVTRAEFIYMIDLINN